ncbi:hypothetical protein D9M68_636160 [compost metagenome]
MDFSNRSKSRAPSGFFLSGRGEVSWDLGRVTVGNRESYRGGGPFDFPFPPGVLAHRPAHGGKLSLRLAGRLAALLHGFGIGLIRPDVAAKRVQFHPSRLTGVDPAA